MGDGEDGSPGSLLLLEQFAKQGGEAGVLGGSRFVKQQDVASQGQEGGEADALVFAA